MRTLVKNKNLLLIFVFALFALASSTGNLVKVTRVVDGDTIVLDDGTKVRLIGIDTPETKDPRKPVQYFGEEASAYTKRMLEGRDVRLEYDQQRLDKYGRTLAYVFVPTANGEIFFNEKIIQDGYAFAYLTYPFKDEYMTRFRNAEREARENNKGLWADTTEIGKAAETDSVIDTLQIPEGYFVGSSKSNKYHKPSCVSAKRINAANLITFKTAEDAVSKGYSPCSRCLPAQKVVTPKKESGGCDYWLNTSTSVRHNSGCRWFMNTKNGRCCGANEGRACGQCGG
jgi:micrococcal nuclease